MIDFDLHEYLEEVENLSIKEKLEHLNNLYAELTDAADEVFDYMERISDEYKTAIFQKLNAEIESFIAENHLEESFTRLKDGLYTIKTQQNHLYISINCSEGEWSLDLWSDITNNSERKELLSSIANKAGLTYKKGSDLITANVDEDNLLPELKSIVAKLLVTG